MEFVNNLPCVCSKMNEYICKKNKLNEKNSMVGKICQHFTAIC